MACGRLMLASLSMDPCQADISPATMVAFWPAVIWAVANFPSASVAAGRSILAMAANEASISAVGCLSAICLSMRVWKAATAAGMLLAARSLILVRSSSSVAVTSFGGWVRADRQSVGWG